MVVVVPFVESLLRKETVAAVESEAASIGSAIIFARLDPLDDEAYFRLLRDYWALGGDFTIVEHDVVPAEGTFASFADCPATWCSSPYKIGTGVHTLVLGCTRFRGELMHAFPEAVEMAGKIENDSIVFPARHWKRIDARLNKVLRKHRYICHAHKVADHLHDYSMD